MLNNGYEPIPVWEKKRPVHSNWQNMSITHDEILGWRGVGPHTGLRTKHMPGCSISIFSMARSNPHKIEVLASGQQVVVAGIHPDTNRPYSGERGALR